MECSWIGLPATVVPGRSRRNTMIDVRGFPEVVTARTQVQTEVHRIGEDYTGCSSRKRSFSVYCVSRILKPNHPDRHLTHLQDLSVLTLSLLVSCLQSEQPALEKYRPVRPVAAASFREIRAKPLVGSLCR